MEPLDAIDLDLDAFRDSVLMHLAGNDADGLRRDSEAVMAPIFVEKFLDEIATGNEWNDLLFLVARRIIEAGPELGHLSTELAAKRRLVDQPNAEFADLVILEEGTDGVSLRLRG